MGLNLDHDAIASRPSDFWRGDVLYHSRSEFRLASLARAHGVDKETARPAEDRRGAHRDGWSSVRTNLSILSNPDIEHDSDFYKTIPIPRQGNPNAASTFGTSFSIAPLRFRCSRPQAARDPWDVAARKDKIRIEVSSLTARARTALAGEDGSDDSVVLRLARLIGRQIAREQFER